MYIKVFYLVLALMLIPILWAYAGLELSFSDTTPPSPLTDEVLPVDGAFTIDVIATAPVGTVAAIDFDVVWTPGTSVDYLEVFAGAFLPGALTIGADANTPGTQRVAAASKSANTAESGVLVTLRFAKKTSEGSVKLGFANISALDLSFQQVTPATGVSSGDISLPVVFSSLSAGVSEIGVTLRWHTMHEMDNAGFDVLRSTSMTGDYIKLNRELIVGQGTSAIPHDYQYIDAEVAAGNTYYYKVEALDLVGDKSSWKVIEVEVTEDALRPPERSELCQNYPNPGNPGTWIPYILSPDGIGAGHAVPVRIEIYNMAGKLVRTLDLGYKSPGRYVSKDKAAHWEGKSSSGEEMPSGVYFYTIKAGSFVATRKLAMLK